MTLKEMIDYVDGLKPSAKAYSVKEKVKWINDIESKIAKEIVKNYRKIEIEIKDKSKYQYEIENIKYEDIIDIYFDNKKVDKIDFRDVIKELIRKQDVESFEYEKITLVVQANHKPYRYFEYNSKDKEVLFNPNEIIFADESYDKMSQLLKVGDFLTIKGASNDVSRNKTVQIKEIEDGKVILTENSFAPGLETELNITRELNDELFLQAPYDEIYCYYIMARIDFLNQEYEAFNNEVALYQKLIKDFQNVYAQSKPEHHIIFKNFY